MLKPVISKQDGFKYENAVTLVKEFLTKLFLLTDDEKQFVKDFNNKHYNPRLLFDKEIADKLIDHPMALWKTREDNYN